MPKHSCSLFAVQCELRARVENARYGTRPVNYWALFRRCVGFEVLGVGRTARPQRSEDGRNVPTPSTNDLAEHVFLPLAALCLVDFFATLQGVVFFNCRAVARQLTPVYRSFDLVSRG